MWMNQDRLSRVYTVLWIVTSLLALLVLLMRFWR